MAHLIFKLGLKVKKQIELPPHKIEKIKSYFEEEDNNIKISSIRSKGPSFQYFLYPIIGPENVDELAKALIIANAKGINIPADSKNIFAAIKNDFFKEYPEFKTPYILELSKLPGRGVSTEKIKLAPVTHRSIMIENRTADAIEGLVKLGLFNSASEFIERSLEPIKSKISDMIK